MEAIIPAVAEITVVYKKHPEAKQYPQITCSEEAYHVLLSGFNLETIALQEQFVVVYLDRTNRVIGLYRMAIGGLTGVVCDPRLVLGVGLKCGASGIILSHNHPSGSLRPSKSDEEITEKMHSGARLLDMKVLDHLLISPNLEYFSFADKGNLST